MKLNRKWIMVLALVMSMAMATTGTLAYLTDRDSEANVFTMGNVEIDLEEEFVQGSELIPGVKIEKEPTITNTGKNAAWVWATVAVPADLEDALDIGWPAVDDANWTKLETVEQVDKDEVTYNVYTYLYKTALAKGDATTPIITSVKMKPEVDIDPDGKLNLVVKGEAEELGWNYNDNDQPIVYVSAYAIQTEGFDTVKDGYEAYNAQWTTEGGVNNGLEWGTPAETVAAADDMIEALESGNDVILTEDIKIDPANMSNAYGTTGINIKNGQTINGNGCTIDIQGAGGTWDSGINTTGGLIKDVTVTGSFRGIFINHNSTHSERVVLDNVTIDGTTYTISCDQGMNQGLTATDSTFNGWTSYAATLGEAEFINCNFGEGNGYAFCRPYAPTTFTNCNFEAGYKMDPRAAVTLENCYLDGVLITADNLATLVTSNIANATVK